MARYQLSKQELKRLNEDLKNLEDIKADLESAKAVGVPNMEELQAACDTCTERIKLLKQHYAGGKK